MLSEPPGRDWKILRHLKQVALERYCERIMQDVKAHIDQGEGTWHARYLALYKLLEDRDDQIATTFDDFRRSSAILQSASMFYLRLIHPDELKDLTPETRARIRSIGEWDGGA